jgi:predicted MPP superfamily phosphohydrolase
MQLRIIPYLLSQYLWVAILSVPLISLLSYSTKLMTKEFLSQDANAQPWNSSAMPTWLMHATDIHINAIGNESYIKTYSALKKAIDTLNPRKIVFTGDLVDNLNSGSTFRPYTEQKSEEWELYKKLLIELELIDNPRLIQVAGNHDFFDILSDDSERHYANGIVYNMSTMIHSRHRLDVDVGTASILAVNTYETPAPVLRLTWFSTPSQKILDELKKELDSNDDTIQIVVQHHPVAMVFPSSGASDDACYSEIIKDTKNVRLILSGHRHPKKPVYRHWGDALEVIGTPFFRMPNRVGLVTIDNRRVVYHDVDLNDTHIAVMTNPTPRYQASGLDVFNENASEVRALYFGETPGNLSVSGSVKGKLRCETKLDEGVWLCSLPFSLPSGNHVIHKEGDWSGDVEFAIAKTIPGFEEDFYQKESTISYAFLYAYVTIICVFLTFPIGFSKADSDFNAWIKGKSEKSNWLFALFAGFVAVRNRLAKVPAHIKYVLFVASVWPLILPICLFGIEDKPAMFWAWNFVGNGKAITGFQGAKFALCYLYFTVLAVILMGSAIAGTLVRSYVIIVDAAVYLTALVLNGYYVYILCDWFGYVWAFTSPSFTLFPLYFLVTLVIYAIQTFKDKSLIDNDLFYVHLL